MHLLNTLPQRLDSGATPTFTGLIAPSLTSPASTALTLGTTDSGAAITVLAASNNVGIGTITPQHKLSIVGGGDAVIELGHGSSASTNWALAAQYITNGAFEIVPSTVVGGHTFTTPVATFLSSGNVGIGTITPSSKLNITGTNALPLTSGTAASGAIRIDGGTDLIMDMGTSASFGGWVQVRNKTTYANNYAIAINPNGGEVLLGTTDGTGLTGGSGLKIASTTAGSAGAGALVITGGLSAGNNTNASYFGGAVTAAGDITSAGLFRVTDGQAIRNTQTGGSGAFYLDSASVAFRNPNTGYSTLMSIGAGGLAVTPAATFAGAVAIANTVSSVSPTSPNRTITMVVGGVTLYIAAKTTND